ncbi:hypothetical protein SV7mr_30650 [Stieleria bergensis]|uniref:Uncharacterized protein n=1 Tax=Stieleria bergensis TaxID=2528025 RepID=A0A517SWV2_9BACT|nr:hypothetical protein SV7mr_30650 [Planctomycetes bacterium SV_7m_r]
MREWCIVGAQRGRRDWSPQSFEMNARETPRERNDVYHLSGTRDCPPRGGHGPGEKSLHWYHLEFEAEVGKETEGNGGRANQSHQSARHKIDMTAEIHEQEVPDIRQTTDDSGEEDRCG